MINRRQFVARGASLVGAGILTRHVSPVWAQSEAFRVGALNPVTGAGSQYGSSMQAVIKAVIDGVNTEGGAAGRELTLFAEDTQTRAEPAVLAAKKLVEVNKVDAILGTWSSSVTLPVLTSVTGPAEVIHMTVAGTSDFTTEDKNDHGWRFTPSSYAYGVIYAKVARELGFTRPATLQFNNSSGSAQIAGFNDEWKRGGGGDVVSAVIYEPNRPSYRSEVQTALAANPDVIICASYVSDATSILREWYQSGVPMQFIIPFWAAGSKLVESLGAEVVEGINTVSAQIVDSGPAAESYDRLYRDLTGDAGSTNIYAAMCYDMANVLALAIEAAGPGATRQQVNDKIREVVNEPGTSVHDFSSGKAALKDGPINYSGAASELSFDADGEDSATLFSWEQFKDGKSAPVKRLTLG